MTSKTSAADYDELVARLREYRTGGMRGAKPSICHAAATAITTLTAEVERLTKRGSEAIIAYHVAICSPKGVVPDDNFYDPVIAAKCERIMKAARTTPSRSEGEGA